VDRVILHSDLNNFFASVECALNPSLKDKPVAVCGNTVERHGIVLAKNYIAKKYGIITGEPVVHADRKCPGLIKLPPNYDKYVEYSKIVSNIYYSYTNLVEAFGIDECWLDVTGSRNLFGNGFDIAKKISADVKNTTGLTVSIGVSYNKIFAKLGSDMKKPDAITIITRENYRDKVWSLPVDDMMGIGNSASRQLKRRGIKTIGQLAVFDSSVLELWFGKNGLQMWVYANGLDNAPVMPMEYSFPLKSIGHGVTTTKDLRNDTEVYDVLTELSQVVGYKLRNANLAAKGVCIAVRDNKLLYREYQTQLDYATQSSVMLVKAAKELFKKQYQWQNNIRSLTIRAINLTLSSAPQQLNMFTDYDYNDKIEAVEYMIDTIRNKYGKHSINLAAYYKNDIKIVKDKPDSLSPMTMYM
jgi:Nucleotidyltransferase/DNA polymerase involved in DNA repair